MARLGNNPGMTVTNAMTNAVTLTADRTTDRSDSGHLSSAGALDLGLPAGLTEVDLDRIAAAATASRAATTRTVAPA